MNQNTDSFWNPFCLLAIDMAITTHDRQFARLFDRLPMTKIHQHIIGEEAFCTSLV